MDPIENVDVIYCPIFGPLSKIGEDKLPDCASVLKELIFIRKNDLIRKNEKSAQKTAFIEKIKSMWIKTSIPILSDRRIRNMIAELLNKYLKVYKRISYPEDKRNEIFYEYRMEMSGKLFDIAACKCDNQCSCESKRIPVMMYNFLIDKRTSRSMGLADVLNQDVNGENEMENDEDSENNKE